MDDQKKTTVLNYITAISGEKVSTLLDLRSGRFYVQVLGLLDQWNTTEHFETDKDRLACVQSFLQDYYGHDVKLDEFLNFDAILDAGSRCSESQLELELAKIAVVLLGIGVLDKNGQHFIASAMKLPQEMHSDVMAIMQSVVQAGSTEVSLTANIEKVLLEPSDVQNETNLVSLATWLQTSQSSVLLATEAEQSYFPMSPVYLSDDNKSPPVSSLQKSYFMDPSQTSTPKETHFCTSSLAKSSYLTDSPLRLNTSGLNYSLREITSPLRGLSIDIAAPSSPLAQFVQSPQLLQKAIIKQKELEIRKLKQLLSDQIFLKDELQFNIQDKTTECANKDGEICKLQEKIKDLIHMRDSYDEFQDLKLRYSEMEREMIRLNKKLQSFEQYKEECQLLEKESSAHCNEVEKLHQDIAALQAEANKYRDSLKTISSLEVQMNSLQLQLDVMHKSKSDWDMERGALQGNLEMAKETIDTLRQEMDELLTKQEENAPGESMGVFMDIQIRELRCQLDELKQERELLLQQLQGLGTTVSIKDCELDKLKSLLIEKDEVITKISDIAKDKENAQCMLQEQLEVLKNEITAKETECLDNISKVADLSDRILLLENELHTQKHNLDTLSEAKTNLEFVLAEKVNEVSSLRNNLSVQGEMLSQQQMDNNVTQGQLRNKEMELADLRGVFDKHKEELAEIQRQLTSKSAAVDMLTEILNVKNADIINFQARELSAGEETKSLQITCGKLKDENEQYQQQLHSMESELQLVRDELTARNAELSNVKKDVNCLKESLEEKSTMCRELGDLISQRSDELLKVQTEVEQMKNELVLSENTMKELKESTQMKDEQLQTVHVDKCRLEEQIQVLNTAVQSKELECIEHMNKVSCLTGTLADLRQELESQIQELIIVCETKSKLEEALKMKEEALKMKEEEFSLAQNNLSVKNETISKLEDERNNVKDGLRCREMEIEDLHIEIADQKKETANMKEQLAVKAAGLEELREALNNTNTEVACLQKEKLSLNETICCLQVTCEQLKIDNDKGKQLQSDTEAELEHARDEMTARHSQMSALTEEMNKLKESLEDKSTTCKGLQDLVSHHSDELIKTQSEKEQMKNELLQFENEVKELKGSDHMKSEQLQTAQIIQCRLEEQLDSLNSQMQARENECLKYKEQVSLLTEQVTDLKRELNSKQQDLNTLCEGKSRLEVELREDKEQIDSLQNDLLCKNETISSLETERNAVKECLKSKEVENGDLHLEIAKYKDEVGEVKMQLVTMSTTVDELTQTVHLKSTEITTLQAQRRSLDDTVTHLTSDYKELKVKNESCEQQLKSSEAECQQLRDQLAADGVQLLTLNAELDIVKKSEEEKTHLHRELQELLSQRTDELLKIQDERDQAKEELNTIENEVKVLKESMHQKNEQLEKMSCHECQLEEHIKALNNQIEDSVKKCSEYTQKVTALTEKVSDLEQERHIQSKNVSSLAEVKAKLEDDLKKEEEKVNTLQDYLTALETERDTARKQIRSKTLDNEDLRQEIVKLKENITEVKEQLVSKSTTLDEIAETLNLKNAEVVELQAHTMSSDKARYNMQVTCDKLKTENHYLAQQFQISVAECLCVQNKVTELQASVEEKSNLCKELEDVISQHSDELHKTQKDRDRIKNELEEHIELLKEQLAVKSVAVEELTATLNLKNVDINDKVQLLEDLTDTVAVKESKISDLCLKLEESTNCVSKLQEEINRTEEQVIHLTNTTQEQGKSIDELTVILQAKESAISELNIELEKQISVNKLKSNENAELCEQIRISTTDIEEQRAMITSLNNVLEEKCDMLKTVSDELLSTEAVMLEKRDELHAVQEQLTCREEAVHSLETQLKEVNLTLQNTNDQVTKRDEIITEKDLGEQELNTKLSTVTSLLQTKVDEISAMNSVIENMQKNHSSELAVVKQETESLKDKLDTRESEIISLAKQKSDLESQMSTLVLEHKAQLSQLAEEHLKAISNAESHYQEITSTKEAEKLELAKQIAHVTGQYEAKIQAIETEHESRLEQLCEDLKLQQQAQKQMEEGLIAQKERTERLDSSMEQEKISHEKTVHCILQEHDRKISVMEQTHASQIAILVSEKDKLLEEMEDYKTKMSELQENTLTLSKEHQQMIQDLHFQQSCLTKEHDKILQEQKATLDKERQAFHKTLAARKEELEKLQADKNVMRSQLTEAEDNVVHHERKIKTLQEENKSLLEREKKLLKESDSQMRTANEFCVSLRKQLESASNELECRDKEVQSLNEQFRCCEQQLSKIKETNTSLTNALKIERDTSLKMQKRMESCTSKYEDMKRQYESMLKENKSYATEVNKLKTALDYSDRKLREYQHQLDQAGTALLGDASHFKQILEEKQYESLDDSIDGQHASTISRTLRSSSRLSSGSSGRKTGLSETVSSDASLLKRDTRASTLDIREKGLRQTEDRMSVCSNSSRASTLDIREKGLRLTEDRMSVCSTSSAHSIRSIISLTAMGRPNAMSCADEPEKPDYEWDRLSELQRRNTMYLPHMKSAYPIEMQTTSQEKFTDDSLRLSLLPNRRGRMSPGEYIRQRELESKSNKRKAVKQNMEEVSGESPPKQIRTGPVYQRPGPPTPAKQPKRISGRFTPSHGISPMPGGKIKALGSPIARPNHKRSWTPSLCTPRRSPRIHSPMSPIAATINEEHQESVTFNIGFTPKKSSAPKKLLHKKGFFSKDKGKDKDKSKATTTAPETANQLGKSKIMQKLAQINRKPLRARNYLETGI